MTQAPARSARGNVSLYLVIRHKNHAYPMLSIGSILLLSFNSFQACFAATIFLSRDSTRFFLPGTESKSALMHSHQMSLPLQHHQGPCYSRRTYSPCIPPPPQPALKSPEPGQPSLDLPPLPPPLLSTSVPGHIREGQSRGKTHIAERENKRILES